MAAFITDGGEANSVFTSRADCRDSDGRRTEFGPDGGLGFPWTFPPQVFGVSDLDAAISNKEVDQRGSLAGDYEAIQARALELQSKIARRQRVGNEACQRGFGDDSKFSRR